MQNELPSRLDVSLRMPRLIAALGITLTADEVAGYFDRLRFRYVRDGNLFKVTSPSYRFDIAIEEDLIEEVIRVTRD